MSELDDIRRFLKTKVGLDVTGVRDEQLERRVTNFCRRHQIEPRGLVPQLSDGELLDKFLDSLTINVTSLFRNADRWEQIARLLPELGSAPKLWSAGCSKGAEAYTMAMLCDRGNVRAEILATDIDNRILATAVEGVFSEAEIREVPADFASKYLSKVDRSYHVDRSITSKVTFQRQDLLAGPMPNKKFDLIACRNVAIYFSVEAKRELHANLARCLRPGGYLFIGSTERVDDPAGIGLTSVSPFIYQYEPADVVAK